VTVSSPYRANWVPHFLTDIRPCREFGQQNVGRDEPVGVRWHIYIGM